ncbi:MAG: 50S ribosomal protein L30 [Acidobacteria bacterium]|nr:MAG: 50S ribosomal protein L30 [Acidobacteriota bacterium]
MSAKAKRGTLLVRQIKSGIGFSGRQKATLRALGLGKVGRSRELPDNPAVRGMLAKIPHLLSVDGDRDKT